ncbi:DUF2911 domain-containing protein [Rhodocytophaga aerolata]|uniref:DUF2911 domain-containing protein n=1 Tax=Rhodocytophaga aerolata TaxID=455078 RepID=A0ABT8RJX5_9BACT|nr:DUF2911 domain-containing protein [Rhodocytophaga aerolata]MDO1451122.1 DUF2911 domain-containing protein [Rhodocytophaga aerolata]
MKRLILSILLLALFSLRSQAQSFSELDKSPMDIAYFPANFAHDRKEGQKAILRVTYSRPARNEREVFGKLVPYGEVWRTGANEATQIKVYQDVELNGKRVKAGSYSLFTIPQEKQWTIILNADLDYWGAYSYKANKDIVRVMAPVSNLTNQVENFTIQFEAKGANKGVMRFAWDQTMVEVPFTY